MKCGPTNITVGELKKLLENALNDDAEVVVYWWKGRQGKYARAINAGISDLNGQLSIHIGDQK